MNTYTFEEDGTAEVHLKGGYVALVDLADLPLIYRYHWVANKGGQTRVYAYAKDNVSDRMISMHRLIANAPVGMVVHHLNGCQLDNRRRNLKVCYQRENSQHSVKRRNSTAEIP